MFDDMKVSLLLGDLSAIHCAANCLEFTNEKLEAREKRNADLAVECERLSKANEESAEAICKMKAELNAANEAAEKLRKELDERSATIQPRAFSPLLHQKFANAKDVLHKIPPLVAYHDGTFPNIPGYEFHSVYKALQELYDALRMEV
jgi:DNA repair exonuclease SbcCD ATPase subunit